jgi:hypothetical protein
MHYCTFSPVGSANANKRNKKMLINWKTQSYEIGIAENLSGFYHVIVTLLDDGKRTHAWHQFDQSLTKECAIARCEAILDKLTIAANSGNTQQLADVTDFYSWVHISYSLGLGHLDNMLVFYGHQIPMDFSDEDGNQVIKVVNYDNFPADYDDDEDTEVCWCKTHESCNRCYNTNDTAVCA